VADKKKKPMPPVKDKSAKDPKAKRKPTPKGGNPFAKKGGLKPPKPMNPGAGSFPPMLGI
jgi:hypothetical protein